MKRENLSSVLIVSKKLNKVIRQKIKLKATESEYEKEKSNLISVYSSVRKKRVLLTPQRPRLAPKQLCYEKQKSPSKIPVLILPTEEIENVYRTIKSVVPKPDHLSSPSRIPVPSKKTEGQKSKVSIFDITSLNFSLTCHNSVTSLCSETVSPNILSLTSNLHAQTFRGGARGLALRQKVSHCLCK